MNTVVAIGETSELDGFALAGVRVVAAATDAAVMAAWQDLDHDVGLVILSSAAADILRPILPDRPDTLTVTTP